MSDHKPNSPESSETPAAAASGKRRPARSRSGKQAKSAQTSQPASKEPVEKKITPPYPVFDTADTLSGDENTKPDVSGGSSPQAGVKRNKRRRKKGKDVGSETALAEDSSEPGKEAVAAPPRPSRQIRPNLDSESVAKLAWKIYLAEVSEEGVALIGEGDAKELARRCFRLAEIFMEEQSRRS